MGQIRAQLAAIGVDDPEAQNIGTNGAAIQFRSVTGQSADAAPNFVQGKLQAAIPGLKVTGVSEVGAKVSGELIGGGVEALGAALGLTLLYIWFRFQLQFGLGAIIALAHDIILTIGFLSFIRIEVSMTSIAALLTVIGYSMNEKVISFDRLRENLRKYKTTPLREVINLSENERLSRTIITGTTALLALSRLGARPRLGAVHADGAMAFGILVGTYSSIYVALPVILLWGVRRDEEEAQPIRFHLPARRPLAQRRQPSMRTPPSIDAFGPGGFRVDGAWRAGSLLIIADAPRDWRPRNLERGDGRGHSAGAGFAARLGGVPAAGRQAPPCTAAAVRPRGVAGRGLGLEFMATEAAARLHNVLASQGRLFATALIAI